MTDLATKQNVPHLHPELAAADDWQPITEAVVERVLSIEDPALRNLWITQSYADLGRRLLDVLGTDQTWCSFATWASNTAGLSIRGHELPRFVTDLLAGAEHHATSIIQESNAHVWLLRRLRLVDRLDRAGIERIVNEALAHVSEHIAHGNTLVYGELAPIFVRFVERLETDGNVDDVDDLLEAICVPSPDDEPLVHQAFRNYAEAVAADNARDRAQFVLTANIAAVLHEQERLQGDIAAALDAGLIGVADELASLCHRLIPGFVTRRFIDGVEHQVTEHVRHLWDHVTTKLMMTMEVPGETLHLGHDVPPLPDGKRYPGPLRRIARAELRQLMRTWDTTRGTGRGSGVGDWADLHQRMDYIVNLLRSRQQRIELTASPFTAEQLDAIERDERPHLD